MNKKKYHFKEKKVWDWFVSLPLSKRKEILVENDKRDTSILLDILSTLRISKSQRHSRIFFDIFDKDTATNNPG